MILTIFNILSSAYMCPQNLDLNLFQVRLQCIRKILWRLRLHYICFANQLTGFLKHCKVMWKMQKQPFEDVLQNRCSSTFCNIHRKTPLLESLFNKFIKKRLQHRYFLVNIAKKWKMKNGWSQAMKIFCESLGMDVWKCESKKISRYLLAQI